MDANKLKEHSEALMKSLNKLTMSLPMHKLVSTKAYRDFNKSLDKIIEIGCKYADLYMEKIKAGVQKAKGEKMSGQSIMEQWLIEGKMSSKQAIQTSARLLSAGMDTVSNWL